MTEPSIFLDPTRCYVKGCQLENEILLHLTDEPVGMADLCWQHAEQAAQAARELITTCDCAICARARPQLWPRP